MVLALVKVAASSCKKWTLTGVLLGAAFNAQGSAFSFTLLRDTVSGLQDLDIAKCILFADEVSRPSWTKRPKLHCAACLCRGWSSCCSRSFLSASCLSEGIVGVQIANRQEQGWIATAKKPIELTHDVAKGARTVAASSRETLVGSGSGVVFRGKVGSRSQQWER